MKNFKLFSVFILLSLAFACKKESEDKIIQPVFLNKILFVQFGSNLYTVNPDGSSLTQITHYNNGYIRSAGWMTDGSKIVFDKANGSMDSDLYIINSDGTNEIKISTPGLSNESYVSFSPYGKKIVFSALENYQGTEFSQIYTIGIDGSDLTKTSNFTSASNAKISVFPNYSPDGSHIVFCSNKDKDDFFLDIYVMDEEGNNVRRLTNSPNDKASPQYSPDGNKILYLEYKPLSYQLGNIWVMNSDGSAPQQITNFEQNTNSNIILNQPSWSPDGSKIVFASNMNNPDIYNDLYIINSDGSNLVRITNNGNAQSFPKWR